MFKFFLVIKRTLIKSQFLGSQTIIVFLLSKSHVARLGCHVFIHEGANGGDILVKCADSPISYY